MKKTAHPDSEPVAAARANWKTDANSDITYQNWPSFRKWKRKGY
jgi:hypothetical protein